MTRVALCGAGMAAGAHAVAARLLGWPVVAVASRRPERAAAVAAEVGAGVAEVEALAGLADLVVVATPPACHLDHASAALIGGARVLVEQPLAATLADADRLVDLAARHGDRLAYAAQLAFAPVVEALVGGARRLGPVTDLEVRALTPAPDWGEVGSPGWGGGALFTLGPQPVALALLLAAPATVQAVSARLGTQAAGGTDHHAQVWLRLSSGTVARVVASWQQGAAVWDAQVAGATGVVRAELLPEPALERNGEPVALPASDAAVPALEQYGYLGQLRAAAAMGPERPPVLGAAFGRLVLEVVTAAYASAGQAGTWVPLPYRGRRDLTPWSTTLAGGAETAR